MRESKIDKGFLDQIELAVEVIGNSGYCTAFTGAGMSVESGIPPFRGENGIWNRYDPKVLDIGFFHQNPEKSWQVIKEIFYDFFEKSEPNRAHTLLAEMEKKNLLRSVITQNIDNLHFEAGSRDVIEYHGNSRTLICTRCGEITEAAEKVLRQIPPRCSCGGIKKPNFVFFGEEIPASAVERSGEAVRRSDCMILIGTTGEVYPAALIPREASRRGATIVEINPSPSLYTHEITDIFIRSEAVRAGEALLKAFFSS